jgi:toxin ParE1/3/4
MGIERLDAAERYFDRIEEKVRGLQDQPRRGPRRPDIRPGARMLVEAPYPILYETVSDTDGGPLWAVVIVRVVDGRRDLPSLC